MTPARRNRAARSRRQRERIKPAVGPDIQPAVSGNQRLEMAQTGKRRAGEQYLASVAAEAVQPVVAFRAEDPDDRIGLAVGRRDDRCAGFRRSSSNGINHSAL